MRWSELRRNRPLRLALFALVVVAGLGVLGEWLLQRWSHVHVMDARIAANVVTLSSETSGQVSAVAVVAGQAVPRGALLVGLETRRAELALEEIDAQIAGMEAQRGHVRAQQDMIRTQVASRVGAGKALVVGAQAEEQARTAEFDAARGEFERMRSLRERNMISAQRFEEAQAKSLTARQQARRAAAGIETAEANLAATRSERAQIEVLERQMAVLASQERALLAQREQLRVDLDKRQVRSAFDGVVDATFVDEGEYVSAGTRLLMYHDPKRIWIDANVKETEFRRLQIGESATITVDAYPERSFKGKVVQLGQAATSQFALLPNPNPSGNFTKVTQRLPVRIAIDQQDDLLRPGMMVEATIDVVD